CDRYRVQRRRALMRRGKGRPNPDEPARCGSPRRQHYPRRNRRLDAQRFDAAGSGLQRAARGQPTDLPCYRGRPADCLSAITPPLGRSFNDGNGAWAGIAVNGAESLQWGSKPADQLCKFVNSEHGEAWAKSSFQQTQTRILSVIFRAADAGGGRRMAPPTPK